VNFISASADSSIKIWDMKTKTCIDTLIGHSGNVMSVMQLQNGLMICGSSD
jgi:WD40 repeat protein